MNLVLGTATFLAALLSVTLAADCERDLILSLDLSPTLSKEQFERTKTLITETFKNLSKPQNSIKPGLISFSDNAAQGLVTLMQGDHGHVVEREIAMLVQKTGRPSLMKALQMMQTFFKDGNGERPAVPNQALIFISGEPSNIIGCLKAANAARSAGIQVFPVALIHEEPLTSQKRDFINFLGTIAGGAEQVHILNPNDPNFLAHAAFLAGIVCPSQAVPKPIAEKKEPAAVTPTTTEAPTRKTTVEPVEQLHKGNIADYKPAGAELMDEITPDETPEPITRISRVTTTKPPTLRSNQDPDRKPSPGASKMVPQTQPEYNKAPSSSNTVVNQPAAKPSPTLPPAANQPRRKLVEVPKHVVESRAPTKMDMRMPGIMPFNIVSRPAKTTTSTTTTTTTTMSPADMKAVAFCQEILSDAEVVSDQYFGNPEDCTSFYQCSLETGVMTAKLFKCQPGMFWKEQLKQCMPGVACKDRCEEPAVQKRGVWADPNNCRRWYQCANGISYPACCPAGTAYDDTLTTCVTTPTCNDECEVGPTPDSDEEEVVATTKEPRFDANGCHDRWGGLKRPNRRNPMKYLVHIGKGHFVPVNCPTGTRFDLIECDCLNENEDGEIFQPDLLPPMEEEPEEIHAWLYFPFDENLHDYSNHRLWVTPVVFGGAWVDQRIRVYGDGSARISSSGIAVPGLSGADFRDHLSIAMWVRCYSVATVCHGDLFANGNNKALPTVKIALREIEVGKDETTKQKEKHVAVELAIQVASVDEPVTLVYPLPRASALASWTHLGLRYDGYALSLFVNGTLINEVPAQGNIGVSMTQIVVAGAVVNPHQFRGYIDEVIVLPVALDDAGMKGLLKADMARLAHDGWIKV